ncbi:hypothetical protein ACFY20_26255 [Streptomyces sp. NPDC001312]|uniref:hypothetical protein n=1 Tax=Streptomyces sp. NPDC001312 TaxID=3364561 RepID=UPI0036ABB096
MTRCESSARGPEPITFPQVATIRDMVDAGAQHTRERDSNHKLKADRIRRFGALSPPKSPDR